MVVLLPTLAFPFRPRLGSTMIVTMTITMINSDDDSDNDSDDDSDDDNDAYNHNAMKQAKLQRHCVHRRHHCRHRHRTKLIRHAVLVPGASWFTPLHDVDRCSPMYRMYRMISWRLSLLC